MIGVPRLPSRSKKAGTTTIKTTLGAISGSEVLTVTGATLTSIAISPATANVNVGSTQQFTATGTFADGTTSDMTLAVRWTTSDFTVGTISSSGTATGVKTGSVTITATYGTISATAALTVN
jgi:uncharacterized protein YjdB